MLHFAEMNCFDKGTCLVILNSQINYATNCFYTNEDINGKTLMIRHYYFEHYP